MDLSRPGTIKGSTIEPKNNWPIATHTSDNLSNLAGDKGLLINAYNSTSDQIRSTKPKLSKSKLLKGSLLFEESNVGQEESNQQEDKGDQYAVVYISNINFVTHNNLLSLTATTKNSIEADKSNVKTTILNQPFFSEKLGTINAAPNQPAEKLINKSAIAPNQTVSNLIAGTLTKKNKSVRKRRELNS